MKTHTDARRDTPNNITVSTRENISIKRVDESYQTTAEQIKVISRENTARVGGEHLDSAGNNLLF